MRLLGRRPSRRAPKSQPLPRRISTYHSALVSCMVQNGSLAMPHVRMLPPPKVSSDTSDTRCAHGYEMSDQ